MKKDYLEISFKLSVVGIDPISKGSFIIKRAYIINTFEHTVENTQPEAEGFIYIEGVDNPLYVLAKEDPLRLQGLIGSVDFGIDKRFIRIKQITHYELREKENTIYLYKTIFQLLNNMDYVENVFEYKNDNLL